MSTQNKPADQFARQMQAGCDLPDKVLYLAAGSCRIAVRTNSEALMAKLTRYFSSVLVDETATDFEIIAIDSPEPNLGVEFLDWKREPGKTGRKDSYFDFPHGRLVRKVKTGLVFLQSDCYRIAAGACADCDNQVINFINAQYMNWLQRKGWLICHAAALVQNNKALAMAGFSGGGKSTLMLHMLEHADTKYLTNDRLFIRKQSNQVLAAGIPKLPRINPGTIVHNPRLHALIPAAERDALMALPKDELWHLEDKYDVLVDDIYGQDRIIAQAPLAVFLVLNWSRDSQRPFALLPVNLAERRELLTRAIMKSPGPFYQHPDGHFHHDDEQGDQEAYLAVLDSVPVYEARGKVDFNGLASRCIKLLNE